MTHYIRITMPGDGDVLQFRLPDFADSYIAYLKSLDLSLAKVEIIDLEDKKE